MKWKYGHGTLPLGEKKLIIQQNDPTFVKIYVWNIKLSKRWVIDDLSFLLQLLACHISKLMTIIILKEKYIKISQLEITVIRVEITSGLSLCKPEVIIRRPTDKFKLALS